MIYFVLICGIIAFFYTMKTCYDVNKLNKRFDKILDENIDKDILEKIRDAE